MYLLYSLVLSLLFLALLPYFAYQAARHGKYSSSLKERMGRLPESLRSDGRKTIWVHAVSVGEFLAATPLIRRLRTELPAFRIVVSTTTIAGQQLARSQSHLFDAAFYFPFDWMFSVRRSLTRINPSVVIILETELWPNFLLECRNRNVVTVLANGRISARSFRRYQLVARPLRRALEDLSVMVMQSEADAERARLLGAPASRVSVCGNLKYDSPEDCESRLRIADPRPPTTSLGGELDRQFALSLSPHLIVAGSTAPGEEEMLLASLGEVRRHGGLEDARLLLAPRHPERFESVARLIGRSGFTFARRSESRHEGPDVILLDTIGELAAIYQFAAVVFVGGSLVPRGGHNIVEPAAFAKAIIVGPHTQNFRQMISDFAAENAIVQIADARGLSRELIRLLSDCDQARAIGGRALDILIKNRGATNCTIAKIKEAMGVSQ